MNIERTKINMSNLRQNANFNALVELLKADLAEARELYENTSPASEFQRGKVIALKELLVSLTGN